MTEKQLIKVAKLEIALWDESRKMPRGLAGAILFAFIHRVTTGNTIEETFFPEPAAVPNYEI